VPPRPAGPDGASEEDDDEGEGGEAKETGGEEGSGSGSEGAAAGGGAARGAASEDGGAASVAGAASALWRAARADRSARARAASQRSGGFTLLGEELPPSVGLNADASSPLWGGSRLPMMTSGASPAEVFAAPPISGEAGVRVSTCGHGMHAACAEK
jgi:hypothetical protein